MEEQRPRLQIAGATDGEIGLGRETTSVRVPVDAPDQSLLVPLHEGREPRVFLTFEDVADASGTCDVYVNLPEGADPALHPDHLAGRLELPGPGGPARVLEISEAIRRVRHRPDWSGSELGVALVPVAPVPEGAMARIGRIAVHRG